VGSRTNPLKQEVFAGYELLAANIRELLCSIVLHRFDKIVTSRGTRSGHVVESHREGRVNLSAVECE
jgi:hypothetical protein